MGWSLRNKNTGGQTGSGTSVATVSLAVTAGDLIAVHGFGTVDMTACADTEGNSYTKISDQSGTARQVVWYAVATSTTTLTITVTFGTDTSWKWRYVNAAAFNPGGDTINLATDDTTAAAYSTSRTTSAISATENDVLGIAHFFHNIGTHTSLLIAGSAPDDSQSTHAYGQQFWSIFTAGVSSKTAYGEASAQSWMQLHFALFELESVGSSYSITNQLQGANVGSDLFNGSII